MYNWKCFKMTIKKITKNKLEIICDCEKIIIHSRYGNDLVKCSYCGAREKIIRKGDKLELKSLAVKKENEYKQYD